MDIANPPADSMAAVDPAAVETLRPLDRQWTKGEQAWSSILILSTNRIQCENRLPTFNISSYILMLHGKPYLKENRETVAGHGCATKASLRAYAGRNCEFTHIDILDKLEGVLRSSRMSSST